MILQDAKYSLKQNEAETRARLRAFWNGKSMGRPALHILADNQDWEEEPWLGPALTGKEKDLSPEWAIHTARGELRRFHYLAEAFPKVDAHFGSNLALTSVLAGGDYLYDGDQAWIEPLPGCLESPRPVFDPGHPAVTALAGIIRSLAVAIGNCGYINPPVIGLDGLTALSLFRTPEQLCFDLLERPEDVKVWCRAFTRLTLDCYEHFYEQLSSLGYGEASTWLPIMTEGRFEAV